MLESWFGVVSGGMIGTEIVFEVEKGVLAEFGGTVFLVGDPLLVVEDCAGRVQSKVKHGELEAGFVAEL